MQTKRPTCTSKSPLILQPSISLLVLHTHHSTASSSTPTLATRNCSSTKQVCPFWCDSPRRYFTRPHFRTFLLPSPAKAHAFTPSHQISHHQPGFRLDIVSCRLASLLLGIPIIRCVAMMSFDLFFASMVGGRHTSCSGGGCGGADGAGGCGGCGVRRPHSPPLQIIAPKRIFGFNQGVGYHQKAHTTRRIKNLDPKRT